MLELGIPAEHSIDFAILIGLVVTLLFTESLGWVFAGVVVPGYLGVLFVVQPSIGIVVVLEALVTWGVGHLLARVLSRAGVWTDFFGRDRFFLLLLVSTVVRQHSQVWGLALLSDLLYEHFSWSIRGGVGFFSVGLVLVPLTANMMWKLNLSRGLSQLAVLVGITTALLALLVQYTDLSFSHVQLLYEDVTGDFLGHAKAHIILLSTAFVAAHFNLRYGWDYGGILIPALVAILYLRPIEWVATIGETLILVVIIRFLLRLPGFRSLNLEGPRKIVFIFIFSLGLKLLSSVVQDALAAEQDFYRFYGYGYLMSSLLALKIIQRRSVPIVLFPTIFTSFLGFALGSLLGFAAQFVSAWLTPPAAAEIEVRESERLVDSPNGVLLDARLRAEIYTLPDDSYSPRPKEAIHMWQYASRLAKGNSGEVYELLRSESERVGYQLRRLDSSEQEVLALIPDFAEEESAAANRASALIIPSAPGPVLLSLFPQSQPEVVDGLWAACLRLQCRAIVISASDEDWQSKGVGPSGRILRAFEQEQVVLAERQNFESKEQESASQGHRFEIAEQLPDAINLRLWPELEVDWAQRGDFHRLLASKKTWHRWLEAEVDKDKTEAAEKIESLPSFVQQLQAELDQDHENLSRPAYRSPSSSEQLLLEREVIQPLVQGRGPLDKALAARLQRRASELGFSLANIPSSHTWVLDDRREGEGLDANWVTVVVRRDWSSPLFVELPHANRSPALLKLAYSIWNQEKARAIVFAKSDRKRDHLRGDVPGADEPNPNRLGNFATAFNSVHRGILRALALEAASQESDFQSGPVVLQLRRFAEWRPIDSQLVVGFGDPFWDGKRLPQALQTLFESGHALEWVHDWSVSDGSAELIALSGAGDPTIESGRSYKQSRTSTLWFHPSSLSKFRPAHDEDWNKLALRFGLSEELGKEEDWLLREAEFASGKSRFRGNEEDWLRSAGRYFEIGNPHILRELLRRASKEAGLEIQLFRNETSEKSYLAFRFFDEKKEKRVLLGSGLRGKGARPFSLQPSQLAKADVRKMIANTIQNSVLAGQSYFELTLSADSAAHEKKGTERPKTREGGR